MFAQKKTHVRRQEEEKILRKEWIFLLKRKQTSLGIFGHLYSNSWLNKLSNVFQLYFKFVQTMSRELRVRTKINIWVCSYPKRENSV